MAAIFVTETDLGGAVLIYKPTNTLIRQYAIPLDDYFANISRFNGERLGSTFYAYPLPNDGLERIFPSCYTPRTVSDETGNILVQPIRFDTDGPTKAACRRLGNELVNSDDITFYTVPKYHLHLLRAVARFKAAHPHSRLLQPYYAKHGHAELDDGFDNIVKGRSRLATVTRREKLPGKGLLPSMAAYSRIEIRCPDSIKSTSAEWTVSVIARDIWVEGKPPSDTLVGVVDNGIAESPRTIGDAISSGEFSAFDTALLLAITVRDNAKSEMSQLASEFIQKLDDGTQLIHGYQPRQSEGPLPDRPIMAHDACMPCTIGLPRGVLERIYAMHDAPIWDDWDDPYNI